MLVKEKNLSPRHFQNFVSPHCVFCQTIKMLKLSRYCFLFPSSSPSTAFKWPVLKGGFFCLSCGYTIAALRSMRGQAMPVSREARRFLFCSLERKYLPLSNHSSCGKEEESEWGIRIYACSSY